MTFSQAAILVQLQLAIGLHLLPLLTALATYIIPLRRLHCLYVMNHIYFTIVWPVIQSFDTRRKDVKTEENRTRYVDGKIFKANLRRQGSVCDYGPGSAGGAR